MTPQPIPDGFHTVTPYLVLEDVAGFLDFAAQAFGAEELERLTLPSGRIMHAEIKVGDSPIMMGGAKEEFPARPGMLYLYVEDADATYAKALAAGATSMQEMHDAFYGDRNGGVSDPFGNIWWIATRVEDVAPEEIQSRAAAWAAEHGG